MRDDVHARLDRHVEALDGGRVRLDRHARPAPLLHDRALHALGEGDEVHLYVAARPVLEEVDARPRVFADRGAHGIRRHPHEVAARPPFPRLVRAVHEGLAHMGRRLAPKISRERPVEADDVAGEVDPAAGRFSRVDHAARLRQRIQRPPGVEDGRLSRLERELRGFQHDLVIAALILDERLEIEIQVEMEVRVHQPGDDVLAPGVDDRRSRGNVHRARRTHRSDPPVHHHDDAVFDRRLG